MKLIANNEIIECSKVIKGVNYLKIYDTNENCIGQMLGISDFSGYTVEDGEFSNPELTEIEQVQLALVELAGMIVGE